MSNNNNTTPNPYLQTLTEDHINLFAQLFAAKFPDAAWHCKVRLARAATIARSLNGDIREHDEYQGVYEIKSASNSNGRYLIDTRKHPWSCTCPDHPHAPKKLCKHILALGLRIKGPSWIDEAETAHAKRSIEINYQIDLSNKSRSNISLRLAETQAQIDKLQDELIKFELMDKAEAARCADLEEEKRSKIQTFDHAAWVTVSENGNGSK